MCGEVEADDILAGDDLGGGLLEPRLGSPRFVQIQSLDDVHIGRSAETLTCDWWPRKTEMQVCDGDGSHYGSST